MSVTKEEVARIAALAKLRPEEPAMGRLTSELNGILDQIRILEEVDLPGASQEESVDSEAPAFRDPDLPPDPLSPGAPGDRAPHWVEGFFVVPRLPALDADKAAEGDR